MSKHFSKVGVFRKIESSVYWIFLQLDISFTKLCKAIYALMLEEIIIFLFSFFIIKRALLDFFLIMKVAYAYLQCLYYENSSAID